MQFQPDQDVVQACHNLKKVPLGPTRVVPIRSEVQEVPVPQSEHAVRPCGPDRQTRVTEGRTGPLPLLTGGVLVRHRPAGVLEAASTDIRAPDFFFGALRQPDF
jgi:hypothetical protein